MTAPLRRRPAPLRATVRRTTRISPHLLRVTVTGDDLTRFRWPGPAGHLKLMLPDPRTGEVNLPAADADGLIAFDRSMATAMRTYTARRYDPDTRELDIDVVLHGDGLASTWAEGVKLGDNVAVSVPRAAGFTEDPTADWTLIAGDASALPAIATITASLTRPATVTVLVELDDPADRVPLAVPATWLSRNGNVGDELARAVLGYPFPEGRGQLWIAAEASIVRHIRSGLAEHFNADQYVTRGYWRAGHINHPDHDYGEELPEPGRARSSAGR